MKTSLFIFLMIFSMPTAETFAQKKSSIAATADIREIILETGDGFCFDCERVTTLRARGERASYHAGKNSHVRRGDFSGKLAAKDFIKLAREIIKNGFFDLAPRYEGTTSDVASVKITIIYKDGQKTVESFGGSDEPRFRKIERTFKSAADKIIWQATSKTGDAIKF